VEKKIGISTFVDSRLHYPLAKATSMGKRGEANYEGEGSLLLSYARMECGSSQLK